MLLVFSPWFLGRSRLYSVLSTGVLFLLYRPLCRFTLGIDNKNVCNNIGRVLSGWSGTPFSLCTDGDLLRCIDSMILYRSARSVRVSKVKGHATDTMVAEGKVRREDKDGNDAAEIAADFGRLRQPEVVNRC